MSASSRINRSCIRRISSSIRFLYLDLGLKAFGVADEKERLRRYRRFIYATGDVDKEKGKPVDQRVLDKERKKGFKLTRAERFKYKTRYFTDAGVGSWEFVRKTYQHFKDFFHNSWLLNLITHRY
jgi:hypothetical protein